MVACDYNAMLVIAEIVTFEKKYIPLEYVLTYIVTQAKMILNT